MSKIKSKRGLKLMVKHIILWALDEKFSENEKQNIRKNAKNALEGLSGKIPGLIKISVQTERLASSNADMMLVSEFDSEESLKGYAVHPLHVAAADQFVRPYTTVRMCIDYQE